MLIQDVALVCAHHLPMHIERKRMKEVEKMEIMVRYGVIRQQFTISPTKEKKYISKGPLAFHRHKYKWRAVCLYY